MITLRSPALESYRHVWLGLSLASPQRSVKVHLLHHFIRCKSRHNGYGYSPLKVASSAGWLRNPNQVTVEMDLTEKNRQCLDKYETQVGEKYKETVDGKFEGATDSMLQRLKEPEDWRYGLELWPWHRACIVVSNYSKIRNHSYEIIYIRGY